MSWHWVGPGRGPWFLLALGALFRSGGRRRILLGKLVPQGRAVGCRGGALPSARGHDLRPACAG